MSGHLNGNTVSIPAMKTHRLTKEQAEVVQKTMEQPCVMNWEVGTGKTAIPEAPIDDTARFVKGLICALRSLLVVSVLLWCMLHAREIVLWISKATEGL